MSVERINFFGKCLKDFLEGLFAEKMTLRELSSKKKMVGKIILRKKWLRKIDWDLVVKNEEQRPHSANQDDQICRCH